MESCGGGGGGGPLGGKGGRNCGGGGGGGPPWDTGGGGGCLQVGGGRGGGGWNCPNCGGGGAPVDEGGGGGGNWPWGGPLTPQWAVGGGAIILGVVCCAWDVGTGIGGSGGGIPGGKGGCVAIDIGGKGGGGILAGGKPLDGGGGTGGGGGWPIGGPGVDGGGGGGTTIPCITWCWGWWVVWWVAVFEFGIGGGARGGASANNWWGLSAWLSGFWAANNLSAALPCLSPFASRLKAYETEIGLLHRYWPFIASILASDASNEAKFINAKPFEFPVSGSLIIWKIYFSYNNIKFYSHLFSTY